MFIIGTAAIDDSYPEDSGMWFNCKNQHRKQLVSYRKTCFYIKSNRILSISGVHHSRYPARVGWIASAI